MTRPVRFALLAFGVWFAVGVWRRYHCSTCHNTRFIGRDVGYPCPACRCLP